MKKRILALFLAFCVTLATASTFATTASAATSIAVTLNKPMAANNPVTKYSFVDAEVSNNDSVTSITFAATKSTTIASVPTTPAASSKLESINGTTRVYAYSFAAGITSAQSQAFIRGVVFNYVADAEISVTVDANKTALPTGAKITKFAHTDGKDHYYIYVSSAGARWSNSYNLAKSYTYMGMTGYLATITSQQEDALLTNISTSGAWTGGTRLRTSASALINDEKTYTLDRTKNVSYFYWACGPEAGTIYYNSISAGSTGYNGAYVNWQFGEPNNYAPVGGEECMQVNYPKWNDQNANNPNLDVSGYFVEFSNYTGGMDSSYASDKTAVSLYNLNNGITDIATVADAKTAAQNASYANMTQAAATDEAAIKEALKNTAVAAVSNSGITISINKVSYTAPIAGTSANPGGTNGSYTFTVTVSKGGQGETTEQKTIVITATPYTGVTDAQAVAAAKTVLGDETVNVAFGASQADKTAAVQAYVNGLLTGDAAGVTATVSYNSDTGKYDVALSKGSLNDSKSLSMTVNVAPDPDIATVAGAKTAAQNASYANMTQAAATDEDAIKAALKNTAETAVSNSGITVTINSVSYTVPVAGTSANPGGTNGSYTFTVTVSKGGQGETTEQKTIVITATPYSGTTDAAYAITANAATGGSYTVKVGSVAVTSAEFGNIVTITPTAASGYELNSISVCKTGDASTTVTVSGSTFTMPAYAVTVSVTFRAAAVPSYTVTGDVTGADGDTVSLSLWRGRSQIGTTAALTTHGPGTPATHTVTDVPAGEYNVVAYSGNYGYTVTKYMNVSGDSTFSIDMAEGRTESLLDIGATAPSAVEQGLHELFADRTFYSESEEQTVTDGGKVQFKLLVEAGDSSSAGGTAIQNSYGSVVSGSYFDLSVVKNVYSSASDLSPVRTETLTDLGNNYIDLLIDLPFNADDYSALAVVRVHDNAVQRLAAGTTGTAGEWYEILRDTNQARLHVNKFSTYAFVYSAFCAVTFDANGGSATEATRTVAPGDAIGTLPAATRSGYIFDGWSTSASGGTQITASYVIDSDVILYAHWTYAGGSGGGSATAYYTITATAGDGGSISPSGSVSVARGNSKTFTITPDEGYSISDVLVDGASAGAVNSYTFSSVTAAHTLSAVFSKLPASGLPYYLDGGGNKVFLGFSAEVDGGMKYIAPEGETVLFTLNPKSFTDTFGHWAQPYIGFVTERELFLGTGGNSFSPDTGMTRAMFATVIGRLYERSYGEIAATSTQTFTDCDYAAYYGKYIDWASASGIINGYGSGKFGPDDQITREQMAAILYRFADFLDVLPSGMDTTLTYPDTAGISAYAKDAALYCQSTGIITGRTGGVFAPQGTATRAEVATIIERFIRLAVK